jgi:hypothetical protein
MTLCKSGLLVLGVRVFLSTMYIDTIDQTGSKSAGR